jgi:PmbA protein
MIAEFVIKKAKKLGADDVIANFITGETKQIRFANNSISVSQIWPINKLSFFIAIKNKILTTTLDDVSETNVERTIKKLIATSKFVSPKKDYYGIADGKYKYKPIKDSFDKRIENISEECVDFVEAAKNKALEYSKRTAGVLYTNVFDNYTETSSGISAKDKMSSIQISIRAFNEKDESGHGVFCSRVLNKFNPEKAGEKAGIIASQA